MFSTAVSRWSLPPHRWRTISLSICIAAGGCTPRLDSAQAESLVSTALAQPFPSLFGPDELPEQIAAVRRALCGESPDGRSWRLFPTATRVQGQPNADRTVLRVEGECLSTGDPVGRTYSGELWATLAHASVSSSGHGTRQERLRTMTSTTVWSLAAIGVQSTAPGPLGSAQVKSRRRGPADMSRLTEGRSLEAGE